MASFANLVKSRLTVVSHWRLNETSGTAAADLCGAAPGVYTGSPTLGAAGSLADKDKVVTLNGSSQYVTMGSVAALRPTAAVSLDVLFSPSVVNVTRQSIAGCGSTTKGYLLCLENSTLKFYVNGTSVSYAGVQAGSTYYVAAVFTGTAINLYVHGILAATTAVAGPIDYTGVTNFIIGQRHGIVAGEYLAGTVDEVAVHSAAHSAAIVRIHQSGRASRGPSETFHAETSGRGNGWTDLTADRMGTMECSYGINGSKITDRVAETGTLKVTLNNSAKNSAGIRSRYSPDSSSCLAGWNNGIRVRYGITTAGVTRYIHTGTIDVIDPVAGIFEDQVVVVTSVDYMDDLARAPIGNIPVQVNQTDSQVVSTILATMVQRPTATTIGSGLDTFAFSLDKVTDENTSVLSVLADVAISSLAFLFVQGGTLGDTLVYEPRQIRAQTTGNVDTFLQSQFVNLQPSRDRQYIINRAKITAHPKGIDSNPTTKISSLTSPILIPANSNITVFAPYYDPVNKTQRIGATNIQPLVKVTNYTANSQSDGLGTDLTNSLDPSGSQFFGNTAMFVIQNNAGVDAWVTKLDLLGKGIYDYSPLTAQVDDAGSQLSNGMTPAVIDMIYQNDPNVASEVAYYIVNLFKNPRTQAKVLGFVIPNSDDVLANRVLRRSISDRIGFAETMSGLAASAGWFINHVTIASDERGNLTVEFILTPADTTAYWLLEVVGRGELDSHTVLGFGLITGHTDIAHGDTHTDTAHSDTAHTDTHTDDAHQDTAHGDGATHGDTAHSDTAHNDVAHTDVSHSDSHADDAHGDVAHGDSHSDTAHGDVTHDDVAHADGYEFADDHTDHSDVSESGLEMFPPDGHADSGHSDVSGVHDDLSHSDSHGDVTHSDSHADDAHSDSHSDSHNDVSHGDVTHGDVAHVDTAHSDSSGHADSAHSDTAHGDVAHGDVSHADVVHSDTHGDTAHGDAG